MKEHDLIPVNALWCRECGELFECEDYANETECY